MQWSDLEPVLVAVAIGVMIGAERERSHGGVALLFGGARTYAILGATGALAALVSPSTVAVGLAMVGLLLAISYSGSIPTHPASTTTVTGLATYLLGAVTRDHMELAVAVGILIVVLLLSKERFHRLFRRSMTDDEVVDAVKLLVVAFVVLPLLPDRGMGPYGVLNPFKIWMLVVAIVGIGGLGYLGVRLLGAKRGLLVSGFAGGFVSASATTAAMGHLAKATEDRRRPALAGALAASVSTMAQLLLVVSVTSRTVASVLWKPALAAAAVLALGIGGLLRSAGRTSATSDESATPTDPDGTGTESTEAAGAIEHGASNGGAEVRAFALRPALILTAVITATVLVSRWAAEAVGNGAAIGVSALAGFADSHAGAASAASLAARGDITTRTAVWAAAAAIGTNTLVKLGLATIAGGRSFGVAFAVRLLPAAAAFAAVLVLVVR